MANPGTTAYPGGLDAFDNPGTTTYEDDAGYGHFALHSQVHDAIKAIENVLGTTAGTSVLKNFAAGQFPLRVTGGGATGTMVSTIVGGTLSNTVINNGTFGTVSVTGGTITGILDSCSIFPGTSLAIGSASWTSIPMTQEEYDSNTMHGTANNDRITIKKAGIYTITGGVGFAANTAGDRYTRINLNGGTVIAFTAQRASAGAANETRVTIATQGSFAVNDYITLDAFQDGASSLNVLGTSRYNTFLNVHQLS